MPDITLGGNEYPSFETVAGADVFLAGDVLRAVPWATRTDDQKGQGLVSATRMLLGLPWVAPAPTSDDDPIADVIKEVTAMLASDLLVDPDLFADASGNSNVKSVKAGSASVEFFRPVEGGPAIPTSLWNLLRNAGLVAVVDDSEVAGALVTGTSAGCRPYLGRYDRDYPVAAADYD